MYKSFLCCIFYLTPFSNHQECLVEVATGARSRPAEPICEPSHDSAWHEHMMMNVDGTRRPQSGFTGASHNLFVTLRKNWQEVTEIGESL
ncbi:hypothetical protein BYT27DRAFT_6393241 [Phlegmacium glaucopus]|nr:hypothetical protein BYT27DRAFT_6393241 [Phlegmacium glaucopus]